MARTPILKVTITSTKEELSYPLNRDSYVIGRAQTADIVVDSVNVSREHARIFKDGDTFRIEDLGSRNGILWNGTRIDRKMLVSGDVLQIGDVIIEYHGMSSRGGASVTQNVKSETQVESDDSPGEIAFADKIKLKGQGLLKNKRVLIYSVVIIGLVLFFVLQGKDSTDAKKDTDQSAVDDAKKSDVLNPVEMKPKEEIDNSEFKALYRQAILFHDVGKVNEALATIDTMLAKWPGYKTGVIKKGEWTKERDDLARSYMNQGIGLYNSGYYDEAMSFFDKTKELISDTNHPLRKQADEGLEKSMSAKKMSLYE